MSSDVRLPIKPAPYQVILHCLPPALFKLREAPDTSCHRIYRLQGGLRKASATITAQGCQHAETLRQPGITTDAPIGTRDIQPVVQVGPGQAFLYLAELTPDPALEMYRLRFLVSRSFQTALDLPVGARLAVADTMPVPNSEL
jgi:hypothetical protein